MNLRSFLGYSALLGGCAAFACAPAESPAPAPAAAPEDAPPFEF